MAAAVFFGVHWYNLGAEIGPNALSAEAAYAQAQAGHITLVDIRRPDEWRGTGIPKHAVPLDMRQADFTNDLAALVSSAPGRPVALICARGVRSAVLARRLAKAGFTDVMDVPEGMLGSGAGSGWLARGLPVVQP